MAKKWTDEELNFLFFAYPNEDYSVKEISDALNRSSKAVMIQASFYILKRPKKKDESPDGYKKCSQCKTILPVDHFFKSKLAKDGLRPQCKCCSAKYRKIKDAMSEDAISEDAMSQIKKCSICQVTKPLGEFHKNTKSKDGHSYYCKDCSRIIRRKNYITGGYKND